MRGHKNLGLRLLAIALGLIILTAPAWASETASSITEAEGNTCLGKDKNKGKAQEVALLDAKKKALSGVLTYLESSSKVTNFVLEKDAVDAYARGTVQVLEKKELGWKKDGNEQCFGVWIRAEVLPDPAFGSAEKTLLWLEDPSKPLTVRCWTDKESYKQGEKMRVFLKGNKPFFARLAYKDAGGKLLQLLPNPLRRESRFEGGVTYQVPAANDRFDLEIMPPFGSEQIILYAGSNPLGDAPLKAADAVFVVQTTVADLSARTRGVRITERKDGQSAGPTEFSQFTLDIRTGK